jgi:(p)ppGpp synthase/HD superfamily hydrolase
METEEILKRVEEFADNAHGDQQRKYTSERYIVHPVRVMKLCKEYTNDITLLAAALLHDVLEDTPITKEEMRDYLIDVMGVENGVRTVQLVEELTDVYVKDRYPDWNRRKRKRRESDRIEKTSSGSQTVKYADIIDNTVEIADKETDFARVFLFECKDLLKRMTKGSPQLYHRATKTVDDCILQLKNRKF